MRKHSFFALAFAAILCFASCEPEVFSMLVDMRHPSKSGLDLSGKTISVVYLDDLSGRDTVFNAMVAEGFSKALEDDYFGGAEAINIFRMEKDMAGDYSSRDTLVNAAVKSGDDVIFLFDSPQFGDIAVSEKSVVANASEPDLKSVKVAAPFKLNLYVYNTMGEDDVNVYRGSSSFSQQVFCKQNDTDKDIEHALWESLGQIGETTGQKSAGNFLSTWETESFYFYYYDYNDTWVAASQAAYEYRWHDAISSWMDILETTNNLTKRSAAEYDIALAFYLLGDFELSQSWLTRANEDSELPLASVLQRKLVNKLANK